MGQNQGLLTQSSKYRTFISDRNKALEQMQWHAQTDCSRFLADALHDVEREVSALAQQGKRTILNLAHLSTKLEWETTAIFDALVSKIRTRMLFLRVSAFSLSALGQIEALGQATQKTDRANLLPPIIHRHKVSPTITGEELKARIWLDCMNLRTRILSAFRRGIVQELDPKDVVAKVKKEFPRIQIYKRPPRELAPVKEANYSVGKKKEFVTTFVDDAVWDQMVADYKSTQLPPSRFDNEALIRGTSDESQAHYAWELEQTLTEDFVQAVRAGDVAGAKEMGIQEFIWVAILDDRTDDCCAERHGLTTSEIAAKVEEDDFESDCDALYPPAHFNCRCQLSPVASAQEVEGPDWVSFQDWLNNE